MKYSLRIISKQQFLTSHSNTLCNKKLRDNLPIFIKNFFTNRSFQTRTTIIFYILRATKKIPLQDTTIKNNITTMRNLDKNAAAFAEKCPISLPFLYYTWLKTKFTVQHKLLTKFTKKILGKKTFYKLKTEKNKICF